MKKTTWVPLLSTILIAGQPAVQANASGPDEYNDSTADPQTTIIRDGAQPPTTGAEENFTGNVTIQPLFEANKEAPTVGGSVTFEEEARTAWHTHPTGQRLVITEGTGWVQEEGEPIQEVSEGDVVWFPPGVRHWHGASPDQSMTHLALTGVEDGENAEWQEQVTDEEYNAGVDEEALTEQEEQIVQVASYAATGEMDRLEESFHAALDAGLTINEVKEVLVQLYPYAGFPRSLNATELLMTVVQEREEEGIEDEEGPAANSLPQDADSITMGTEVQTELAGGPVEGPLFEFAPIMNDLLQSHLFGDIFARNILDHETRELVTIAALTNMEGTTSQLQSHFGMGMNAGLTEEQIEDVIGVFEEDIDQEKAAEARELWEETTENSE